MVQLLYTTMLTCGVVKVLFTLLLALEIPVLST